MYVDKIIWEKSKAKIIKQVKEKIGFPCLAKDIEGTDSRGISIIKNIKQCQAIVEKVIYKYKGIIIEQYIKDAYEITCFVMGNKKLITYEPVGIIKNEMIISGKTKDVGINRIKIPADLPKNIIKEAKKISMLAHRSLGCRTFSRADILVKNKKLYLLEVDVHPGFRAISPTCLSVRHAGQSMNQLFLEFYKLIK